MKGLVSLLGFCGLCVSPFSSFSEKCTKLYILHWIVIYLTMRTVKPKDHGPLYFVVFQHLGFNLMHVHYLKNVIHIYLNEISPAYLYWNTQTLRISLRMIHLTYLHFYNRNPEVHIQHFTSKVKVLNFQPQSPTKYFQMIRLQWNIF